jgi:lysophospholipase L1-like esterase
MGAYTSEVTKTANGTWASFSVTFVKASTASQLVTIVRSVNSSTPANLKIINARLFSGASDLGIDALAGHMYFGATNFENQVTVASGIMSQNTSTKFGTIQFSTSKSLNSFSGFVVSRKTATDAGKHQPVLSKIGTPDFLSWSMLHCGSAVAEPSCMVTAERAYTTGGGLWQPRLNEWHLLAYRYNGTTLTFWLDGVKAISVSLSSLTQSVIDLWVGCLLSPSNTFSKYDVNAIALYDSALSDANMVLAADVLIARAANSGISIGGSRYLYCEGDSLTNGTGGSNSQGYAQLFGPNSSPGVNGSVGAISGGTLADVVSRAAATDAILPTNKRGKVFVHSLLIGANDIYNITPATYAATISSYMAARKAAGWDKTVLGTILPRGTANHNTNRNAFNAIVTAGGWAAANNVDAIADFAAQATMGPDAAYLNATYYGDGVHPTAAGYALLEPVFRSAVNGL